MIGRALLATSITLALALHANDVSAAVILSIDSDYAPGIELIVADQDVNGGTPTSLGASNGTDINSAAGQITSTSSSDLLTNFSHFASIQTAPSNLFLYVSLENLVNTPIAVRVMATLTDQTGDPNQLVASLIASLISVGTQITATTFIDPTNSQFGIGGTMLESIPFAHTGIGGTSTSQYQDSSDIFPPLQSPYSLTHSILVELGGRDSVFAVALQSQAVSTAVPEPSSWSLLFAALLAWLWRRRRTPA